jgi:hypothetical protein
MNEKVCRPSNQIRKVGGGAGGLNSTKRVCPVAELNSGISAGYPALVFSASSSGQSSPRKAPNTSSQAHHRQGLGRARSPSTFLFPPSITFPRAATPRSAACLLVSTTCARYSSLPHYCTPVASHLNLSLFSGVSGVNLSLFWRLFCKYCEFCERGEVCDGAVDGREWRKS